MRTAKSQIKNVKQSQIIRFAFSLLRMGICETKPIFQKSRFLCKFFSGFETNISVMAERTGDEVVVADSRRGDKVSFENLIEQYSGRYRAIGKQASGLA